MIDALEALVALHDLGTMGKAAAKLRVTQSAVSKRLATLEAAAKEPLTERNGRRVALTPHGLHLVAGARPLLLGLKELLQSSPPSGREHLVIGVSDSILSSWGAALFRDVARRLPQIHIDLHAHRSVLAVEMVRSGDYAAALCADPGNIGSLQAAPLFSEPMVIVPSGLEKVRTRAGVVLPVMTIEESAATWVGIREQVRRHAGRPGKIQVVRTMESFAAVAQMAAAGFGHGLVPLGVARALRVKEDILLNFDPGLFRRISLIARASTLARPGAARLIDALRGSKITAELRPA